MQFVADSSLPEPSVAEIRALGNQVHTIEDTDGADLERALEAAVEQNRLLLTFEMSVHDLVYGDDDHPSPPGIVCFQLDYDTPHEPANLLAAVIGEVKEDDSDLEIEGFLTLLEAERLRQKSL